MKIFSVDKKEKVEQKNLKALRTGSPVTWCPGCPDYSIMEAARRAMLSLISKGVPRELFTMVAGVGCHGKMFDYLNISGVYSLHGRALPTAMGISLGNPNLKTLVFCGDGDTYAEGMAHFIEAPRFNANMTLIVHDNQSFSLTTGQATPTSQQGFKTKADVTGEQHQPFNPIRLALAAGCGFVARCNARDFTHTAQVIEAAINYPGFAFVEVIQDCIIFNLDINDKDSMMYTVKKPAKDLASAMALAEEWNYNGKTGKIPIGILYNVKTKPLDEKWVQLQNLKKEGVGWKYYKKQPSAKAPAKKAAKKVAKKAAGKNSK